MPEAWTKIGSLGPGDVGYIVSAASRSTSEIKIGRHDHARQRGRRPRCCRAIRKSDRWCFADFIRSSHERLRETEGGPGEATFERLGSDLFLGELGRARLRLPLRLPGPAAHGGRPGAHPPRIRRGDHLHLSERGLQGEEARWRGHRGGQPHQPAGPGNHRSISPSPRSRPPSISRTSSWAT